MRLRQATEEDAGKLAYLINLAGEGIPYYLWSLACEPGSDPWEIGRARAARSEGDFSYPNATVAEYEGDVVGMVLGYRQPDPYPLDNIDSFPEVVRPLVQLEAQSAGSWYINAIAMYDKYRGQGIGTALMAHCELQRQISGAPSLSLIVASENNRAKELYERLGFVNRASLPIVGYEGGSHRGDWILMVKEAIQS